MIIYVLPNFRQQLRIPAGISILHVEQEVTGDETIALDSVLEADAVRTGLLRREKELLSQTSPEAATELSEVYAELSAIEADKAPAIASVILAGLGFSAEAQKRATKTFSGIFTDKNIIFIAYIQFVPNANTTINDFVFH